MSSNTAARSDSFVDRSAVEKTFDWPEKAHPSITLNLEVKRLPAYSRSGDVSPTKVLYLEIEFDCKAVVIET